MRIKTRADETSERYARATRAEECEASWNEIGKSGFEMEGKEIKICPEVLRRPHPTAKQVISLCGKDENSFEIYKNEKRTCKACKSTVFHQVVKYANL